MYRRVEHYRCTGRKGHLYAVGGRCHDGLPEQAWVVSYLSSGDALDRPESNGCTDNPGSEPTLKKGGKNDESIIHRANGHPGIRAGAQRRPSHHERAGTLDHSRYRLRSYSSIGTDRRHPGATMTVLADFPMLNQLADVNEANKLFDCVPTCIAACLEWLLKKPFDGGAIKDTVYGASYQGGTSADRYVKYCAWQGVKLSPLNGTPAQLVADIRFWIGQQMPLIGTEPDPYVNASLGWSHVIAFYGADTPPGTLTCLDPYGGHPVTLSDAEWEKRLQFNQVWKLEKEVSMGIPQGWRDQDSVLYSPSNTQGGPEVPITGPFRDYILANNWPNSNVALEAGHHVDQLELSNASLGGGFQQTFRYAMIGKPDSGALAGKVVFEWLGQELLEMRRLYAKAQAEIAQLQAQPAGLDAGKVKDRLSAIGLASTNGNATIQSLVTQPI
jgi:hypothetical protein